MFICAVDMLKMQGDACSVAEKSSETLSRLTFTVSQNECCASFTAPG